MLKWISGFFRELNANSNPAEIAHALALGVLLGFMPKTNALWYMIFVFFLLCDFTSRRIAFRFWWFRILHGCLIRLSLLLDIRF